MKYLIASFGLVLACAVPSAAQMRLDIKDGLVTLDAVNVPARQILAEWARVGGTKVVGAEKITGAPLTLKLTSMAERQALDIILRNVAGFIAAPRQATAAPGRSHYDRILILATSTVAPAPTNASRGIPNRGVDAVNNRMRMAPRPPQGGVPFNDPNAEPEQQAQEELASDGEPMEADATDDVPPVFTFPSPQGAVTPGTITMPQGNPVFVPVPQSPSRYPQMGNPVMTLQPGPNGPVIYNYTPGQAPQPTSGFGVIGSPTPGMMQIPQPTPEQQTPIQPPPPRPPGV